MSGSKPGNGFTFLEILVALAVLGSAFTVLLAAHASAVRQEAAARRLMTATLLARQVLTDTEVNGVPGLGGDEGDFGEKYPRYAWERQVERVALPIDLPVDLPTDRLVQVRIRVTWLERGETAATELVYFALLEEE
jgi:prepilin-type N-terminal cleavage/methylation domain-containing protein